MYQKSHLLGMSVEKHY